MSVNNADYITLSCPSCGHKLQITEDIDRFACAACGNEHIVNRSGGVVTLKPIIDSIQKVQVGVDKTASELAIVRLKNEIGEIESKINSATSEQGGECGIIGVIAFGLLALVLLFFESTRLVGLVIGVLLILMIVISNSETNKGNAKKEKETIYLRNELDIKKKELAEHQETVTKYK
jgi:predicted RNA-binding Zn-ribbon protein involved in translation (DUF1610 family)